MDDEIEIHSEPFRSDDTRPIAAVSSEQFAETLRFAQACAVPPGWSPHVIFRGGLLDGKSMHVSDDGVMPKMLMFGEGDTFEGRSIAGKASFYRRMPEPDKYGRLVYRA